VKEHLDELGASGEVAERDQVLYYFTLHDFNNDGFEDLFICLVHHCPKVFLNVSSSLVQVLGWQ